MQQLQDKYSAVILAYGAVSDRDLNIEGEFTTKNVISARSIVNWYNGSLDCDTDFDLSQTKNVALIGNGNVACDIARMLLKPPAEFLKSDTPKRVLEILS